MAINSTNPTSTPIATSTPIVPNPTLPTCKACGKPLKRASAQASGHGALCAQLLAKGITSAKVAQYHKALSLPALPKGYIFLAQLDKAIKANPTNGCTISKMVKCTGQDKALYAPMHPIAQVWYVGRNRVLHGWLATKAGMVAMATGNYSKAPKFTQPKQPPTPLLTR